MQDDQNAIAREVRFGNRRTRILMSVLGMVLLCSVLALIAVQLGQPTATLEKVGTLADFPVGSVTRVQLRTTFVDRNPRIHAVTTSEAGGRILGVTPLPPQEVAPIIFLVNDPEYGLLALYARDPHSFGCWVTWEESTRQFVDPCGGSKYTRTGEYIDGPAPRGLDRFGVVVTNDGRVLVSVNDYQQGPPRP